MIKQYENQTELSKNVPKYYCLGDLITQKYASNLELAIILLAKCTLRDEPSWTKRSRVNTNATQLLRRNKKRPLDKILFVYKPALPIAKLTYKQHRHCIRVMLCNIYSLEKMTCFHNS